jgi:glycosyltransferase involved in cell wall biosynthesis
VGLGCDSNKVTEVPYTVPVNAFRRTHARPSNNQAIRLLFVGQLIQRKGILPFIENLNQFCFENPKIPVELTIAGAGPLAKLLKIQTLAGRGTIRFLGTVQYRDLPSVYADADMFVFPTLADEWGVVVNEAMASGLPVFGSIYSQAVEELVKDGINGWVFRPDNVGETLAKLAQALFASTTQLEQMGTMAAKRISVVTPDAAADQIVDVIEKVLHPSTLDLRLA